MSESNQHKDINSSGGGRRPRRTNRGTHAGGGGPKAKGGHAGGGGPKAKPKRGGPKKDTGGKYTSKLPMRDLVDKMKTIKRGWKGKCKVRWTIKSETDDEVTYDLAGSSEDVTEFQRKIGLDVIIAYKKPELASRESASRAPVSRASASRAPASRAPASRAPVSRAPASRAPVSRAPVSRAPVSRAPVSRAPVSRAPVNHIEEVHSMSLEDTQPYFGGNRSQLGLDSSSILSAWKPESFEKTVSRRGGNYLDQLYQHGMTPMTHQPPTIIVVNNNFYA